VTSKIILKILRWKKSFNKTKTLAYIFGSAILVAFFAYFVDQHILGSGKALMNATLFTTEKYSSWSAMLSRIIGPIICFNSGAAGGIFAPALAAGASIGSYVAGVSHVAGSNANILILAGMVGFLTGITRTPFTSAILVLEMTDRHSVIFHLMLAALISNLAALIIDKHSLYEQLKKGYVEETLSLSSPEKIYSD